MRLPSKITFFFSQMAPRHLVDETVYFIAPALTTSKSEAKYALEWKPSLLEAREVQSCRWITSSWMLFFVRVRHRGLHVTVRCRSASRHECGDVAVLPSVQQQEMEELRKRRAAHHRRNGTCCSLMSQVTVGRRSREVVLFSSTREQGSGRGRCRWVCCTKASHPKRRNLGCVERSRLQENERVTL